MTLETSKQNFKNKPTMDQALVLLMVRIVVTEFEG